MEHRPAAAPRAPNPDWFTGTVAMTPIIEAPEPARVRAVLVEFQPGARTNWHTHPLGQALWIVSGKGLAGTEDGTVVQLAPGDVVWFAPGERHWHGAAPDSPMSHLAIQEARDGSNVDWAEPVSDADYTGS